MAKIVFHREVDKNIYYLKIAGNFHGSMGQFYMLRGWTTSHPVLSRPLSIFDLDEQAISFVYKVVGEGTQLLSRLRKDDEIELYGPYGNGFPPARGKVALVGGGMGLAPLYLAACQLRKQKSVQEVHTYLGFKESAIFIDLFEKVVHKLVVDIGGLISKIVDVNGYDYVFTCGPQEMVKTIVEQKKSEKPHIFLSLEKRMGCGIGACLSCTCQTSSGNKLTCKDGPVFPGEEIYFE